MTAMSSSLLELILDLLSDEDELKKYEANSDKYLFDAGLGGCAAEVDDAVALVRDYSPSHASADTGSEGSEGEEADQGGHDGSGNEDNGGWGNGGGSHGGDVHNSYVTHNETHNTTSTHNGDMYDISAEGDVALAGGINFGKDNEIEDFDYNPQDSFNDATVGGNGVAATGNADVDIDGGVGNTNGSGVMNADVDGDLNSAGGTGGAINTGEIDHSSTDDHSTDVDVDHNTDIDVDHDTDIDVDVSESGPGDQEILSD
jgi:hypothetical protein